MSGELRTRVITGLNELHAIAREWRELWASCPNATPFQRPEWLLRWTEIFSPEKLHVIEVRRAQELIALAPLLIYTRDSSRILAFAGGGVSDYLDALVHPAFADEGLAAVFQAVEDLDNEWDIAEFTDLASSSPLLRLPCTLVREVHDACPVLEIARGASELSDFVPPRQLRNLRNARHRTGKLADVSIEKADVANATSFLDALFRLHSARWNSEGMPGVLCGANLRAFHSRVVQDLLPKNIVRLYGMRCSNRFIAVLYAIFERDIAYYYLQGFDPEFAWYSPGTQLITAVVEDAVKEGKQQVNFLRGREKYKYAWGAEDSVTTRITYVGAAALRLSSNIAA